MTWKEFYSKYPYCCKTYDGIGVLNQAAHISVTAYIKLQEKRYRSKWKTNHLLSEIYESSVEDYLAHLESVPDKIRSGMNIRVYRGPTPYGVLPVRITSINGDNTERVVLEYLFE